MESTKVNIKPKEFITSHTATSIELRVNELILNKSVRLMVLIKDNYGNVIKVENVLIEGDDYNAWIDSDDYLINLILNRLGLESSATVDNASTVASV